MSEALAAASALSFPDESAPELEARIRRLLADAGVTLPEGDAQLATRMLASGSVLLTCVCTAAATLTELAGDPDQRSELINPTFGPELAAAVTAIFAHELALQIGGDLPSDLPN
jgi:hypothetical protein